MNPKFNVGDKVRIKNMNEIRHEEDVGIVIEVEYHGNLTTVKMWEIEDKYYYNIEMQIGETTYRYWRAEEFLEMVKIGEERVQFT